MKFSHHWLWIGAFVVVFSSSAWLLSGQSDRLGASSQ
jgi:hypothetical protein